MKKVSGKAKAEQLETKIAQAYQVIGTLLSDLDRFESDEGQRALDYFSDTDVYDDDFLPWPKDPFPKKQPSLGLLVSMAIRYDHGLAVPGYYDTEAMGRSGGVSHANRMKAMVSIMRQLWEETSGEGFYKPEKEEDYAKLYPKE